jgi:uncharacterized DUF497 family protein
MLATATFELKQVQKRIYSQESVLESTISNLSVDRLGQTDNVIQMYYVVTWEMVVVTTKYLEAELARHGVTPKDADFVLRSPITVWDDMGPSERGNDRLMFVGFDSQGRLLEVAVEYFDEEDIELVFHGDDATPQYRKLFERMHHEQ